VVGKGIRRERRLLNMDESGAKSAPISLRSAVRRPAAPDGAAAITGFSIRAITCQQREIRRRGAHSSTAFLMVNGGIPEKEVCVLSVHIVRNLRSHMVALVPVLWVVLTLLSDRREIFSPIFFQNCLAAPRCPLGENIVVIPQCSFQTSVTAVFAGGNQTLTGCS
jgi:hypothetical protein